MSEPDLRRLNHDRARVRAAMRSRRGELYMGSMATAHLSAIFGVPYGQPGLDAAIDAADQATLDRAIEYCAPYLAETDEAAHRAIAMTAPEQPTPEIAAPWCRDAWFTLSLYGDGRGTSLHRGWGAICEAVVAAHYFQPDDDQRAEVMAKFTDWEIWENVGGYPWRWFSDYEDGTITVERVTDGEGPDRFAAQRAAEAVEPRERAPDVPCPVTGNDRCSFGYCRETPGCYLRDGNIRAAKPAATPPPGDAGEQMRSADSAHNRQPIDGGEESRFGRESSPPVASPGDAGKRAHRKLVIDNADYWFQAARNKSHSIAERLLCMENALNHTENALIRLQSERTASISAALFDPSDEVVTASAQAGLQVFCQPTIAVVWSELQPMAKDKWKAIARANLHAAGVKITGSQENEAGS